MTSFAVLFVTTVAATLSAPAMAQPAGDEQRPRDIPQGLTAAPDPRLKVLIAEQAPAELVDVHVVRNLNGTPAAVQVTVRNRTTSVLNSAHVACYVFDARPGLRLAAFGVVNRPVPSSGRRVLQIVVNRLDAKPDWTIVVGLEDAMVASQRWTNRNLRQQAEAAVRDTQHDVSVSSTANLLAGQWSANIASSTVSSAFPIQRATLELTVDGDSVTAIGDVVLVSGQSVHQAETFQVDGQEHAFERSPLGPGVLVTARWLGPRVLETTVVQNGKPLAVATYEVSADGQTLTARTTGMVEQVLVFERK